MKRITQEEEEKKNWWIFFRGEIKYFFLFISVIEIQTPPTPLLSHVRLSWLVVTQARRAHAHGHTQIRRAWYLPPSLTVSHTHINWSALHNEDLNIGTVTMFDTWWKIVGEWKKSSFRLRRILAARWNWDWQMCKQAKKSTKWGNVASIIIVMTALRLIGWYSGELKSSWTSISPLLDYSCTVVNWTQNLQILRRMSRPLDQIVWSDVIPMYLYLWASNKVSRAKKCTLSSSGCG